MDSNHRPRAYQARALTTWAMSPCKFSVYLVFSHPICWLPSVFVSFSLISQRVAYIRFKLTSTVATPPDVRAGGDDGNRTHDPLLAGQVLSQLSYTPIKSVKSEEWRVKSFGWKASLFLFFHLMRFIEFPFGHSKLNNKLIGTRKLGFLTLSPSFSYLPTYEYDLTASLKLEIMFSIERRWSSRTFRYGYLVTT